MVEYIFLLALALIIIPVVYWLSAKKKVASSVPIIIGGGFVVAIVGVFVGQNFPFYYTVLIMLGLAFAISVLLDKRLAKNNTEKPLMHEQLENKPLAETEIETSVQSEVAATEELEDSTMNKTTEDDLELWMTTIQEDIIIPEEEDIRSGK